jgi:hypothetical protein
MFVSTELSHQDISFEVLEVDSPYNYDYRLAGMFVEIPDPFTVGRCNHVIRDTARNAY